jgi:hypothetical protein
VYDTYVIEDDGMAVGTAEYTNPEGHGKFQIRVSGPVETVKSYPDEVSSIKLALLPSAAEFQALLRDQSRAAAEFRRNNWPAELAELQQYLTPEEYSYLTTLKPTDAPAYLLTLGDKIPGRAPDRKQDRYIEITVVERPPNRRSAFATYIMEIDPTVPFHRYDVYVPSIGRPNTVTGSTDTTAGNTDLYLYRGIVRKDSSTSTGRIDTVSGSGGRGSWELRVWGVAASTYTVRGAWRLSRDDVPGPPP